MSESQRLRLRQLVAQFLGGTMDVRSFTSQFEHTYNIELDKRTLTPAEAAAFGALFEEVIWYSPFPEDRIRIPNYRGDGEIRKAAELAAQRMGPETA